MSGSNHWDKQTAAAIGSFDGNMINCEHLTKGSFHVIWAGLDKKDGQFTIEMSNDSINWAEDTTYTIDTTAGNCLWKMQDIVTNYIRVSVDNGTNTAGAYKIIFFGRIR